MSIMDHLQLLATKSVRNEINQNRISHLLEAEGFSSVYNSTKTFRAELKNLIRLRQWANPPTLSNTPAIAFVRINLVLFIFSSSVVAAKQLIFSLTNTWNISISSELAGPTVFLGKIVLETGKVNWPDVEKGLVKQEEIR